MIQCLMECENGRDRSEPKDPKLQRTETPQNELDHRSALPVDRETLSAIYKLDRRCLWHMYFDVELDLEDKLKRKPSYVEIYDALDDGHQAWFLTFLKRLLHRGEWDFKKQTEELDMWYQKWEPWFKRNYPEYFRQGGNPLGKDR